MWKRAILLGSVAAVFAVALVARRWFPETQVISGVLEADTAHLGSLVGGRVKRILVEEGARVRSGEKLVVFEEFDWAARLAQAEAARARAAADTGRLKAGFRKEEIASARFEAARLQAVFEELKKGPRREEIEAAAARLSAAEAQLVLTEKNVARVQALREDEAVPTAQLDEATERLKSAKSMVEVRRQELAILERGTRPEELAAAQAAAEAARAVFEMKQAGYRSEDIVAAEAVLAAAEAEVRAIQRRLDELAVTAPFDGTIKSLDLEPGDLASPGAPVVSLLSPEKMHLRAFVPETIPVSVGDTVEVLFDARPDQPVSGKIVDVSPRAEFAPSNAQTPKERRKLVYRIKILILGETRSLRPGMMAEIRLP